MTHAIKGPPGMFVVMCQPAMAPRKFMDTHPCYTIYHVRIKVDPHPCYVFCSLPCLRMTRYSCNYDGDGFG